VIAAELPVTRRLRPSQSWSARTLAELWAYRELLYFFIWRDIKVRYKQTLLGAGWAIVQPLMTMVVFTIFFGHLAKIPSDGLPYPVFSPRRSPVPAPPSAAISTSFRRCISPG
jgi:lipopolysaccharide transport system permease protein